MDIKTFVEDAGKEFDTLCNDTSALAGLTGGRKIFVKNHHLSKLRELIGVWRKDVDMLSAEAPLSHEMGTKRQGFFAALDSVLHLLDEAGGGK